MEHVVIYPGTDGAEAFRRAADLEAAVRLVESLRNDQGITDVSVFTLTPVPLAFRTYVHVELPVSEVTSAAPSFDAPVEPSYEAPAELSFDEPTIPPPPFEAPASFEAPESFDAPASFEAPESFDATEVELPAPPPPPSDFFEPIEEFPAGTGLQELEVLDVSDVLDVPESFFEPDAEEWNHSEADVAWADHEVWSEAEPVSDDVWVQPAPVEAAEVAAPAEESARIAIPEFHENEEELPPLILAPGPLLFDGDGAPIASSGTYDLLEEAPAELTALIPADFTDLIPKDIPHGDLARHAEEAPVEAPAEAPVEEPVAEAVEDPVAEEPVAEAVEEPVAEEPVADAPGTDELPPMDVAEIPSDVSSIEAFEANPIPAAREAVEEPAPVREGPRGLGFFGG